MINRENLCYNCFHEKKQQGVCPYCGYDNSANIDKYPTACKEGSILNGQYILGRVLGQGGFGITYIALDYQLKIKVAIKEYLPDGMATRLPGNTLVSVYAGEKKDNFDYGAECILDEARVLARFMGHKNIVGVRSYFKENNTSYFVMDYIEGISFKNYIKNHGGKIDYNDAVRILVPVMDALATVHKEGIVHRDVTPDNIYITKADEVKLLDFGSARYSLSDKSKSLDVILKAGYAPKEQYIRRGKQGPYTDIYSLAACFYASITGYLPPEALERMENDEIVEISTRGIRIPNHLENAIMKGLEVRAEDRFQCIAEFKASILGELENKIEKIPDVYRDVDNIKTESTRNENYRAKSNVTKKERFENNRTEIDGFEKDITENIRTEMDGFKNNRNENIRNENIRNENIRTEGDGFENSRNDNIRTEGDGFENSTIDNIRTEKDGFEKDITENYKIKIEDYNIENEEIKGVVLENGEYEFSKNKSKIAHYPVLISFVKKKAWIGVVCIIVLITVIYIITNGNNSSEKSIQNDTMTFNSDGNNPNNKSASLAEPTTVIVTNTQSNRALQVSIVPSPTNKIVPIITSSNTPTTKPIKEPTIKPTKKPLPTIATVPTAVERKKYSIFYSGNTSGNISNGGLVVQHKNWVYFSELDDVGLYKMKIDGSNIIKISSDYCRSMAIADGWIYYSNQTDDYKLYKMKTDGSHNTKLDDREAGYINVLDGWIYCSLYKSYGDSKTGFYKLKTDGSKKIKLSKDRGYITIIGDWIYSMSYEGGIYKMKTDGSEEDCLSDDVAHNMIVIGDWIYYVNNMTEKICKIRTDGSGKTKLNDEDTMAINISDDWIYYINLDDDHHIYKMKTDGSKVTKVNDGWFGQIYLVNGELFDIYDWYDLINE